MHVCSVHMLYTNIRTQVSAHTYTVCRCWQACTVRTQYTYEYGGVHAGALYTDVSMCILCISHTDMVGACINALYGCKYAHTVHTTEKPLSTQPSVIRKSLQTECLMVPIFI